MVDDPSNRSAGENGGSAPDGNAASARGFPTAASASDPARNSDSILGIFKARVDLPDLNNIDAGWDDEADTAGAAGATDVLVQKDEPVPQYEIASIAGCDSAELTPAPMVVCDCTSSDLPPDPTERQPTGQARIESSVSVAVGQDVIWRGNSSDDIGGCAWRHEVLPPDDDAPPSRQDEITSSGESHGRASHPGHAEYHPPRSPPTSIAPPRIEASFSVAAEFDPKASTRPRVARNSSVPPAPWLFGLDRMLVWGLVLGGLFVAIIVVIVNQVALSHSRRSEPPMVNYADDTQGPRPISGDAPPLQSGLETVGPNERMPLEPEKPPNKSPIVSDDPSKATPTTSTQQGPTEAPHDRGATNLDGGVAPRSDKPKKAPAGQ